MSRKKPVKYPFSGQPHLKAIVSRLDTIRSMTGHGRRRIIEDWIALVFWAFQRNDPKYYDVLNHYDSSGKTKEVETLFAEALAELVLHSTVTQQECLGTIWMEFCANECMGQFFSPASVCSLMAKMTIGNIPDDRVFTVLDPCSGAGGMLIAAAQEMKPEEMDRALFLAIDLDQACCMMTGINLVLFNMHGHIFHGDALNPEDCRGGWFTVRKNGMAALREFPLEEAKQIKKIMGIAKAQ